MEHLPVDNVEEIRQRCRRMVSRTAVLAGGAGLVPVPGLDIAVDIGLLTGLMGRINHAFGLTPEQIDHQMDSRYHPGNLRGHWLLACVCLGQRAYPGML